MPDDTLYALGKETAPAGVGIGIEEDDIEHIAQGTREAAALRVRGRNRDLTRKDITGADSLCLVQRAFDAGANAGRLIFMRGEERIERRRKRTCAARRQRSPRTFREDKQSEMERGGRRLQGRDWDRMFCRQTLARQAAQIIFSLEIFEI